MIGGVVAQNRLTPAELLYSAMNGFVAPRILPDGRFAAVMMLTYGRGRIGVGGRGENCWGDLW